ncbi:cell cycle control protein 50C-like isoform X2 [Rhineura floridana]|uniref:cell cycle control protein 50C-like isoform X2 n=1 Tax=Rhineura floridana TaxID=261503 RepID=UPI002AC85478|nr:cell cycle control protein 50C-like isoform X2 [Rhineura floridana]
MPYGTTQSLPKDIMSSSCSIGMNAKTTIAPSLPVRCPDNTALKQQKLPAWKPQLTPAPVLSSFFIISLFCLAMGIALILAATSVKEIKINYSEICSHCSKLRENSFNWEKECQCFTNFTLQENMQGDVFMYYGLHNFYQNHRRYVHSRSDAQLLGRKANIQNSNCAPFATYENGTPVAPCGAIANSMFNVAIQVPLLKQGNAWWTDKNVKFHNPSAHNLSSAFAGTARPPYWQKPVYLLDEENEENNGYTNEDFIIWMRVAAFPTFKNLYRRLSRTKEFADGLPAGTYGLQISYNFPVTKFKGEKQVVFSTVTWSGGRNPFLGIAYTVTGAVTLLASCIITVIHLKFEKKENRTK